MTGDNATPTPSSKRVVVTMSVPGDHDNHDLATTLAVTFNDADPTVWTWADFWQDVADGQVTPDGTVGHEGSTPNESLVVWTVSISHRHGDDLGVYSTEEAAREGLYAYVRQCWDDEINDRMEMNEAIPESRDEAIERYFEIVDDESYNLDFTKVQG